MRTRPLAATPMLVTLALIAAAVLAYATWEFLPRLLDDRERVRRRMMRIRSNDFEGAVALAHELLASAVTGRRVNVYQSAAESILLEDAERRGDIGAVATRLASLIDRSPMNGVPLVTRLSRCEAVLDTILRRGSADKAKALATFVEANAIAARVPSDQHRARMRSVAGAVLAHAGELDRAAALQPFDGTTIYSSASARTLSWAAEVAALRGETKVAVRLADEAVRLAFGPYTAPDNIDRVFALARASESHLDAGDAEGALQLVRRAAVDVQPSSHNYEVARHAELVLRAAEAAALVANGKRDDAVQLTSRLLVVADETAFPFVRADVLATAARLAADVDDRTEFMRLQQDAVAVLERAGSFVAANRLRADLNDGDTGIVGDWPTRPQ